MYLGLDLGTSGLRGLVVDETGQALAEADFGYDVSMPKQGWSEQDPADWISALDKVFSALGQKVDLSSLVGIGISGHMHGATCLDDQGEVIRPCILWNDTRSDQEATLLDSNPIFHKLSGNIVFPGFTAPKLMWMAKYEPENFAAISKVLLPKDYLNFWLTGKFSGDMSDSAGTSWLDVGERDWSNELLDASGMRKDQMPELFEGCEVVGVVKEAVAAQFGLPSGVRVVAGAGDNAAAACGIGALDEGQGFVSLGTSGVLLTARDRYAPDAQSAVHSFCHAVPDKWYQMGVILSATDCLNWLADIVGVDAVSLSSDLPDMPNGPSNVTFLPYLSGERTPHNLAEAAGGFAGLARITRRSDLTQAVMEGVCFALRDCLEALRGTGSAPNELLVVGGGSNSSFWVQSLANILNIPLVVPENGDFGAALGAARLAMIGVSEISAEKVITQPPIARRIEPNLDLNKAYEAAYLRYKMQAKSALDSV